MTRSTTPPLPIVVAPPCGDRGCVRPAIDVCADCGKRRCPLHLWQEPGHRGQRCDDCTLALIGLPQ